MPLEPQVCLCWSIPHQPFLTKHPPPPQPFYMSISASCMYLLPRDGLKINPDKPIHLNSVYGKFEQMGTHN